MTSLDDDKVGRERMNIREQVIYLSFFVENALPIGDCMMSMPLSNTYQPSASRPSLTRTSPRTGIAIGAHERNSVKVVEMCAVNGVSQGRILLVCDDLMDLEAHVGTAATTTCSVAMYFSSPASETPGVWWM